MTYMGLGADRTIGLLAKAGDTFGEDEISEGMVAAVFTVPGDAVCIEGTPERIRSILLDVLARLDETLAADLPELVPGEDDDEALCQYVYTEADVAAVIARHEAYNARMRELHGDAANISDLRESDLPVVGATCGEQLVWEEDVADYRTAHRWENGELVVNDSRYGDGNGNIKVICEGGHEWKVPEVNYCG